MGRSSSSTLKKVSEVPNTQAHSFLCIWLEGESRTMSAPVTMTMMPPSPLDGCASSVWTACLTFSKGRSWTERLVSAMHLAFPTQGGLHTLSFCTIPDVPCTDALSKVSMDWSRWYIVFPVSSDEGQLHPIRLRFESSLAYNVHIGPRDSIGFRQRWCSRIG